MTQAAFLRALIHSGQPPRRKSFSIPAVSQLTSLELHPQATFLVGENGSGKSTLIEAIAVLDDLARRRASQFVIATHSPIIMAYPHAKIVHLSEASLRTSWPGGRPSSGIFSTTRTGTKARSWIGAWPRVRVAIPGLFSGPLRRCKRYDGPWFMCRFLEPGHG